jgi:excisionase family DNA binding protein
VSEQSDPLRLLSLREAGAVLGIDWKAVRALVETGEIGAYRTGATGQPRIPRLALVAWQERVARGPAVPVPTPMRRAR